MKPFPLFVVVALSLVGSRVFGSFTTLVDNGPSSNRVDIVFLGDGYTTADIAAGTYDNHIDRYLNRMFRNSLNSDPFYRYRNFFNVHSIEVVSNEAGADVPPEGIFRDTALDASYYFDGFTERLLSINSSKANTARDAALAGTGFTAEMQYVTVNDTRYGGAGGSYAVYAGGNGSASELALHEVAHSFSHLADEYGGFVGPYTGPEPGEINVTKDATGAKWSRWHGYNQFGIGVISAYEGGRYYNSGIYRPSNNSKMRNLNRPFDAVAREKLILDFYNFVDPFDSWLDNSASLINPGELFVDRIDDSVIDMEWFVDGGLVPTANGDTFDLTDFGYDLGDYLISARGFDPTAFDPVDGWVRMNQSELEQYVFWNVTIVAPEPVLVDIKPGSVPNPVNLKSKGVLPVAILSTDEFDINDVDLDSLLFGDPLLIDNGGTAVSPLRSAYEDVSGDGLLDLTLKFSTADLVEYGALGPHTLEGLLTGALLDGTPIKGMDSIRIVPPNGSNGNSLQMSAVPEPTTSALALAALCLAMSRRRAF